MALRSRDQQLTALAMAARDGDRAAAEAFVTATQADVIRFTAHLAGAGVAEDLAQETFIRFMKALPGFEGRSAALTWLLSIARHTAFDHLRLVARRPRTAALTDWAPVAETVAAPDGPRFEEQVALKTLIAALPLERREAFIATQIVGLTYEEAAEVLDCPIGTIRSRVARARDDLVAALNEAPAARRRHLRAV